MAIIQTLLVTCKMLGINPYHYLVDVLQRIALHPDNDVIELTPRLWKDRFAKERFMSHLEMVALNTYAPK